jgi:hypothetical protein
MKLNYRYKKNYTEISIIVFTQPVEWMRFKIDISRFRRYMHTHTHTDSTVELELNVCVQLPQHCNAD